MRVGGGSLANASLSTKKLLSQRERSFWLLYEDPGLYVPATIVSVTVRDAGELICTDGVELKR